MILKLIIATLWFLTSMAFAQPLSSSSCQDQCYRLKVSPKEFDQCLSKCPPDVKGTFLEGLLNNCDALTSTKAVTQLCNDLDDVLCKDVPKEERRACNTVNTPSYGKNALNFFMGCGKGLIKGLWDFIKMVPEMVMGAIDFIAGGKESLTKVTGAYESAKAAATAIVEEIYTDKEAFFKKLLDKISDAISGTFHKMNCQKPEINGEKICKFIGEFVIPPAALGALLIKGPKIAMVAWLGRKYKPGVVEKILGPGVNREMIPYKELYKLYDNLKNKGYSRQDIEAIMNAGNMKKIPSEKLLKRGTPEGDLQFAILSSPVNKETGLFLEQGKTKSSVSRTFVEGGKLKVELKDFLSNTVRVVDAEDLSGKLIPRPEAPKLEVKKVIISSGGKASVSAMKAGKPATEALSPRAPDSFVISKVPEEERYISAVADGSSERTPFRIDKIKVEGDDVQVLATDHLGNQRQMSRSELDTTRVSQTSRQMFKDEKPAAPAPQAADSLVISKVPEEERYISAVADGSSERTPFRIDKIKVEGDDVQVLATDHLGNQRQMSRSELDTTRVSQTSRQLFQEEMPAAPPLKEIIPANVDFSVGAPVPEATLFGRPVKLFGQDARFTLPDTGSRVDAKIDLPLKEREVTKVPDGAPPSPVREAPAGNSRVTSRPEVSELNRPSGTIQIPDDKKYIEVNGKNYEIQSAERRGNGSARIEVKGVDGKVRELAPEEMKVARQNPAAARDFQTPKVEEKPIIRIEEASVSSWPLPQRVVREPEVTSRAPAAASVTPVEAARDFQKAEKYSAVTKEVDKPLREPELPSRAPADLETPVIKNDGPGSSNPGQASSEEKRIARFKNKTDADIAGELWDAEKAANAQRRQFLQRFQGDLIEDRQREMRKNFYSEKKYDAIPDEVSKLSEKELVELMRNHPKYKDSMKRIDDEFTNKTEDLMQERKRRTELKGPEKPQEGRLLTVEESRSNISRSFQSDVSRAREDDVLKSRRNSQGVITIRDRRHETGHDLESAQRTTVGQSAGVPQSLHDHVTVRPSYSPKDAEASFSPLFGEGAKPNLRSAHSVLAMSPEDALRFMPARIDDARALYQRLEKASPDELKDLNPQMVDYYRNRLRHYVCYADPSECAPKPNPTTRRSAPDDVRKPANEAPVNAPGVTIEPAAVKESLIVKKVEASPEVVQAPVPRTTEKPSAASPNKDPSPSRYEESLPLHSVEKEELIAKFKNKTNADIAGDLWEAERAANAQRKQFFQRFQRELIEDRQREMRKSIYSEKKYDAIPDEVAKLSDKELIDLMRKHPNYTARMKQIDDEFRGRTEDLLKERKRRSENKAQDKTEAKKPLDEEGIEKSRYETLGRFYADIGSANEGDILKGRRNMKGQITSSDRKHGTHSELLAAQKSQIGNSGGVPASLHDYVSFRPRYSPKDASDKFSRLFTEGKTPNLRNAHSVLTMTPDDALRHLPTRIDDAVKLYDRLNTARSVELEGIDPTMVSYYRDRLRHYVCYANPEKCR